MVKFIKGKEGYTIASLSSPKVYELPFFLDVSNEKEILCPNDLSGIDFSPDTDTVLCLENKNYTELKATETAGKYEVVGKSREAIIATMQIQDLLF